MRLPRIDPESLEELRDSDSAELRDIYKVLTPLQGPKARALRVHILTELHKRGERL